VEIDNPGDLAGIASKFAPYLIAQNYLVVEMDEWAALTGEGNNRNRVGRARATVSGAGGPSRMNRLRGTYTGYSIGCAIVWAVILAVVAVTHPDRLHTFVVVCAGWLIGWLSATIARSVYPPPKPRQSAT
jgi:hypothetical protein